MLAPISKKKTKINAMKHLNYRDWSEHRVKFLRIGIKTHLTKIRETQINLL